MLPVLPHLCRGCGPKLLSLSCQDPSDEPVYRDAARGLEFPDCPEVLVCSPYMRRVGFCTSRINSPRVLLLFRDVSVSKLAGALPRSWSNLSNLGYL